MRIRLHNPSLWIATLKMQFTNCLHYTTQTFSRVCFDENSHHMLKCIRAQTTEQQVFDIDSFVFESNYHNMQIKWERATNRYLCMWFAYIFQQGVRRHRNLKKRIFTDFTCGTCTSCDRTIQKYRLFVIYLAADWLNSENVAVSPTKNSG